jgi:hypothetical protein
VVEEERACVRAPDGAHAEEAFAEFWRHYPLQVDRKAAAAQFDAVLAAGQATAAELVAGAMRYAADRDGKDAQYTAWPANWLKNERWTDGPRPKANGVKERPQRPGKPSLTNTALRAVGIHVPEDWQQ